ncbi:MAG: homocysteine S-methyltransferase family protein, partial [Eubacteriales bacterium]|nr:homocysteine S-methyltransferase family protein [Eubacteriales bacterium]
MSGSMALHLHGKNWLLLDGATGTQLHQYGLPAGVSPERWVLDHPDILIQIQLAYLEAGSNILLAFTFGANRIKLSR